MLFGRLEVSRSAPQGAKAEVTMGHERPHTERASQLHGLQKVGTGRFDLRGIEARHDLAMQAEGVGLVAALAMLSCVGQGLLRAGQRIIEPVGEDVALAEEGDEDRVGASPSRRFVELYGPDRASAYPRRAVTPGTRSVMCRSWAKARPRSSRLTAGPISPRSVWTEARFRHAMMSV